MGLYWFALVCVVIFAIDCGMNIYEFAIRRKKERELRKAMDDVNHAFKEFWPAFLENNVEFNGGNDDEA